MRTNLLARLALALAFLTPSAAFAISFGAGAVFPDVKLVSYVEHGTGLTATVTVRAVNNGSVATDPMNLSISDFNALFHASTGAKPVGALQPGKSSGEISFELQGPGAQATTQQVKTWKQLYDDLCGVDLRVNLDWKGPQANTPIDNHRQAYLYQGFHASQSWQENRLMSAAVCDDSYCVTLNDVVRSVYKQIGCKVVGYALFVGDKTSGPRGVYDAFGLARTKATGSTVAFTPSTPMQIASSSKVLTGITALKVMGPKFEQNAFQFFPSTWTVPAASIVRNITSRELVSMTSGVKQYYAGVGGQTYANLQAFFTQTLTNTSAVFPCPGPPRPATMTSPAVPQPLPNPIVTDKTPCYTDTNFGIMRLVIPRANGSPANDNATLAGKYVKLVQANIWAPLGITGSDCAPPAGGKYALLYVYPGQVFSDWLDTTATCGDWGWYVSVKEYSKLLVSLNSADHKVLSDCQLYDVENNPANHPVGFDITKDSAGRRYLEKNGAQGQGNNTLQTTSVVIFLGHSGCPGKTPSSPMPGLAAALWIDSTIAGQPIPNTTIASGILSNALEASVHPKP
jgi:CubicO group peptidase (beta-lactamase class C family)